MHRLHSNLKFKKNISKLCGLSARFFKLLQISQKFSNIFIGKNNVYRWTLTVQIDVAYGSTVLTIEPHRKL